MLPEQLPLRQAGTIVAISNRLKMLIGGFDPVPWPGG